jgi:nicotinic acid mononucleotide adenylyltransferase
MSTAYDCTTPLNLYYLRSIRGKIFSELALMASQVGAQLHDEPFAAIFRAAAEQLFAIENLCCDGDIDPRAWVRTCADDELCLPYPRPLRVGFYPLAANPLHWGHLLIGLRAMAELQLDKVVYLTSGRDSRKPGLAPADLRYAIARDLLRTFEPLFACSSLAGSSGCDGETTLFKFLRLNQSQPMEVLYLAGGDHCRRFYPGTEYPDTLVKLELHRDARTYSYRPELHAIHAAFIKRGAHGAQADTDLPVHFLDELPFAASSTMIREALAGTGPERDLALLPYSAYLDIQALDLYEELPATACRTSEFGAALMAVA